MRRRSLLTVAAVAAPPLLLAVLGLSHPRWLTAGDAVWWRDLHLIGLVLFPLLGVPPWLLLRRHRSRLASPAALLGYVYAVCYTALDVLAGIGAGSLAVAGRGGAGVLYGAANAIALPGVIALLVANLLVAVVLLLRAPALAVPGGVLLAAASVSFLTSHIYPPVGVLTMVGLAIGWSLLALTPTNERGSG